MLVTVKYSIGFGSHTETIEVPDDATDAQIDEIVQEMVTERLDWSWNLEP